MSGLKEFEDIRDGPLCPLRGTKAVKMDAIEVQKYLDEPGEHYSTPDEKMGEYWARCISCGHIFIHQPRE